MPCSSSATVNLNSSAPSSSAVYCTAGLGVPLLIGVAVPFVGSCVISIVDASFSGKSEHPAETVGSFSS